MAYIKTISKPELDLCKGLHIAMLSVRRFSRQVWSLKTLVQLLGQQQRSLSTSHLLSVKVCIKTHDY